MMKPNLITAIFANLTKNTALSHTRANDYRWKSYQPDFYIARFLCTIKLYLCENN